MADSNASAPRNLVLASEEIDLLQRALQHLHDSEKVLLDDLRNEDADPREIAEVNSSLRLIEAIDTKLAWAAPSA